MPPGLAALHPSDAIDDAAEVDGGTGSRAVGADERRDERPLRVSERDEGLLGGMW